MVIPARRIGAARDCLLEIFETLPVAAHRQPPAELGEDVGVVWIECQYLALHDFRCCARTQSTASGISQTVYGLRISTSSG